MTVPLKVVIELASEELLVAIVLPSDSILPENEELVVVKVV